MKKKRGLIGKNSERRGFSKEVDDDRADRECGSGTTSQWPADDTVVNWAKMKFQTWSSLSPI